MTTPTMENTAMKRAFDEARELATAVDCLAAYDSLHPLIQMAVDSLHSDRKRVTKQSLLYVLDHLETAMS